MLIGNLNMQTWDCRSTQGQETTFVKFKFKFGKLSEIEGSDLLHTHLIHRLISTDFGPTEASF